MMGRLLILTSFFLFFCSNNWAQEPYKRYVIQLTKEVRLDYQGLVSDSTIPHGLFKLYWNRRLLIKGKFNKGVRNGEWVRYYPDGTPFIKANYIQDKKNGNWIYKNDKGKTIASIHFKNDKRSGRWEGYLPNGNIAADISFGKDEIPLSAVYYFPNGKPVFFGEEEQTASSKYRNESFYYKNGQIALFKQLKNDSLHGKNTIYHRTGAKWEDLRFKNGYLTSVRNMATLYGTPRYLGTFKNGKGFLHRYAENGELFSKSYFKNGVLNDSILFYQNGKIIGIGSFDMGVPTGKWQIYSKYYRLIQEREYFNNGDSIQIKFLQSKEDNEKVTGFFVKGKKQGTWKTYNLYNEVIKEENYNKGFLHGPYYKYEGNVVRAEGNYEWGQKSGQWKYYNSWKKQIYQEDFNDSIHLDYTFYDLPPSQYITIDRFDRWDSTSFEYSSSHPSEVKCYFFKRLPGMDLIKEGQLTFQGVNNYLGFNRKINLGYSPFFLPPSFPGGAIEEEKFVLNNQLVSEKAVEKNVAGFTMVMFKVDEFGFPSNYEVVKTLGFGLDQLSIDLFRRMPFWEPAIFNGIPVETYMVKELVFPEYK